MKKYKTKQKNKIYEMLLNNNDKVLTASNIKEILNSEYNFVGLTTIYRFLSELETEDKLIKEISDNGEARYQLAHSSCGNHLHIKCSKCDKLIHLNCEEIENIKEHLKNKHEFYLDLTHTTLSGLCKKCCKLNERKK